jgi:hypothetical protein
MHLNDSEFADLIDEALPAERRQHLDRCESCRARAAGLPAVLARAVEAEVPEPSPLFWEHFSARVVAAIRESSPDGVPATWRFGWLRRPAVVWVSAAAIAAVVLVATLSRGIQPPEPNATVARVPTTDATVLSPVVNIDGEDLEADQAWALVRTAADDMEWREEDAHAAGLNARPGSAERAVLELSPEERIELARLLDTELRRRGA